MRLRYLLALFLLCIAPLLRADGLLNNIRADYQKKVLLLRGFYQDSLLRYDAAGELKHRAETGPWTTAFVYINSVDLENGKISLKANRVVLIFDPKKQMFRANGTDLPVVIEVVADPADEAAIRQALAKVFIGGREPFAEFVPDYWRAVVERLADDGSLRPEPKQETKSGDCDAKPTSDAPCRIGDKVKAPRMIHTPDPTYGETGRAFRIDGRVVLWTVIDETGHTTKIRIVTPLGCGLDDRAVEAVRRWTFHPATRDGQPVPVQVNIEVNFRAN